MEPGAPVQVAGNGDPGQVLPGDVCLRTGSVRTTAQSPSRTPRRPQTEEDGELGAWQSQEVEPEMEPQGGSCGCCCLPMY